VLKYTSKYLFLGLTCVFILGCNPTKDTYLNKKYQNLTARFNGLYNAKIKMQEGVAKLNKAHKDDYSTVLEIYPLGDNKASKSVFPIMDEIVKKASVIIQRKPLSKFVDDSYLLIGQAYFYKQDYFSALQAFQYIYANFKDTKEQKESLIWIMRCHTKMGNLSQVEPFLNIATGDLNFPPKLKGELFLASADYQFAQKNTSATINELNKSINLSKKRDEKTRMIFIYGQLLELSNQPDQAARKYQEVIKRNPQYEMAFNAKVKQAGLFKTNNTGSKKEIISQLTELLEDEKNKDYRDQIYFALGQIAESEKKHEEAFGLYKESISSSRGNRSKKAAGYLAVADLAYDKLKDYPIAQAYYDSAIVLIPATDERQDQVESRSNSLTRLVENLKIISKQDSLLTLSSLSVSEQNALIEDMVNAKLDAKEREREAKLSKNQNTNPVRQKQTINTVSTTNWYFYNSNVVSGGYNDFVGKWGKRNLEDNWRRKEKQSAFLGNDQNLNNAADAYTSEETFEKEKELLLASIPNSPSAIANSKDQLIEAYFILGNIYRDELDAKKSAIEAHENLINTYPRNKYQLECYYSLYLLHKTNGNQSKSDSYKNLILANYSNSIYAKTINNPNFASQNKGALNELEAVYERAYIDYNNGFYPRVISICEETLKSSPKNELAPNFALLKAISVGKTSGNKALSVELRALISKYPKTESSQMASAILGKLGEEGKESAIPESKVDNITNSIFTEKTGDEYYVLFKFQGPKINVSKAKIALADYCEKNYSIEKLNNISRIYTNDIQFIVLKVFKDFNTANNFLEGLEDNYLSDASGVKYNYTNLIISEPNYYKVLKERILDDYEEYFKSKN
jgi:tetratricopeptide (TPR) repeat protein